MFTFGPGSLRGACLVALSVCSSFAAADFFGPSRDTAIVTGYGYDPFDPDDGKGTPFINTAHRFEIDSANVTYQLVFASEKFTSERHLTADATLTARKAFVVGGSFNFNYSSSESVAKSSFTLNLIVTKDYGTEVLNDQDVSNLTPQALQDRLNPAVWVTKYGREIMTRRRRGTRVVASVNVSTAFQNTSDTWRASLNASGSIGLVSASVSSSVINTINQALATGQATVLLEAYGGDGQFNPSLINPTDFNTHLTAITDYLSRSNAGNSAITRYQSTGMHFWLPTAPVINPINISDAYWQYLGLRGKIDAIDDYTANWQVQNPWTPDSEIVRLEGLRSSCVAAAERTLNWGTTMSKRAEGTTRSPIPADVAVKLPQFYATFNTYKDSGNPGTTSIKYRLHNVRSGCQVAWRRLPQGDWFTMPIGSHINDVTEYLGNFSNGILPANYEFRAYDPATNWISAEVKYIIPIP